MVPQQGYRHPNAPPPSPPTTMSVKAFAQHHAFHTLPTMTAACSRHIHNASTGRGTALLEAPPRHLRQRDHQPPRPTTKVTPDQTRLQGRKGAATTMSSHHPSAAILRPRQLQAQARNRQNRRQPPPSLRAGRSHLPTLQNTTTADSLVAAANADRVAREAVATVVAAQLWPPPLPRTSAPHHARPPDPARVAPDLGGPASTSAKSGPRRQAVLRGLGRSRPPETPGRREIVGHTPRVLMQGRRKSRRRTTTRIPLYS
jgi:hypothetical protein